MRSKILSVQVVLVASWSIFLFDILAGITFAEWPSDPTVNVPICTAAGDQEGPQLVSDGAGDAIIRGRKIAVAPLTLFLEGCVRFAHGRLRLTVSNPSLTRF